MGPSQWLCGVKCSNSAIQLCTVDATLEMQAIAMLDGQGQCRHCTFIVAHHVSHVDVLTGMWLHVFSGREANTPHHDSGRLCSCSASCRKQQYDEIAQKRSQNPPLAPGDIQGVMQRIAQDYQQAYFVTGWKSEIERMFLLPAGLQGALYGRGWPVLPDS